jgi:hypothetical protein
MTLSPRGTTAKTPTGATKQLRWWQLASPPATSTADSNGVWTSRTTSCSVEPWDRMRPPTLRAEPPSSGVSSSTSRRRSLAPLDSTTQGRESSVRAGSSMCHSRRLRACLERRRGEGRQPRILVVCGKRDVLEGGEGPEVPQGSPFHLGPPTGKVDGDRLDAAHEPFDDQVPLVLVLQVHFHLLDRLEDAGSPRQLEEPPRAVRFESDTSQAVGPLLEPRDQAVFLCLR